MDKTLYITDYLRMNAEANGSKPAVIFEDEQTSWLQLWERVEAMSGFFASKLGNKEQKIVDLLLTNSTDFIVVYLAVLHAGHIVLPLDPAYKKLELDAIISQIPPSLIITSQRYIENISRQSSEIILVDEIESKNMPPCELLRMGPNKQVASLTFTSGTSGIPKAVPNTHCNHIWNILACSEVWDWTADDRLLISLPLSHMHGLVIGLSGAIIHGNTLYLTQQAFDAEATLAQLSSGRITIFTHAPMAYQKILQLKGAEKYDISGVRLCISGGAALPTAIWQEFKAKFGVEIVETYGSSETGRIAGNSLHNRVAGSPGRPLPGVELRLSDDGEVLVKSPGLFPGYFKNPQATKEAMTKDGLWRTGDLAELRDGYIFLKGRVQERIRRFSYTVSPRDVEWALLKLTGVKDVFVLGREVADQPNDELLYFIVSELSDKQIIEYCKTNLLFAWRPDRIIHLSELPRNRSGKVKLKKLKEMAEQ